MHARVSKDSSDGSIHVELDHHETTRSVEFRSGDAVLSPSPEAAVASLLLVAMASGADLHIDGELDPRFADNLATIQDVYTMWFSGLERIAVRGSGRMVDRQGSGQRASGMVATFFSGGVDSFYTLMKHVDEIDVLVYVHGFDVALEDTSLRSAVSASIKRTADRLGKRLIEVETTLRTVTDARKMTPGYQNWEISHGSALAAVAHTLSEEIDRIYVPASHTYLSLEPLGSHPLLDPLWSTRSLEVVYDGCEAHRTVKCEVLGDFDIAMEELRVCWRNPGGEFNCGKCEKCRRTMLNLKVAGALERCRTFGDLTLEEIASIRIRRKVHEKYYNYMISQLELRGGEAKLIRAIRRAVRRSAIRRQAGPYIAKIVHGIRNTIGRRSDR